jgi:hypothetical protein
VTWLCLLLTSALWGAAVVVGWLIGEALRRRWKKGGA